MTAQHITEQLNKVKVSNRKNKGFTLIEIMIVVLIIGILLAIAVPNFIHARASSRYKTVLANLKQIDNAKQNFAMEAGLSSADAVTQANLDPKFLKWPTGPVTGVYAVTDVQTPATFKGNNSDTWVANCDADPGAAACGL